uniref:Uncharacterized protein n=1 Tax=Helianthus annuus TaxID=4232 RepID=A0A251RSK9_HELAN
MVLQSRYFTQPMEKRVVQFSLQLILWGLHSRKTRFYFATLNKIKKGVQLSSDRNFKDVMPIATGYEHEELEVELEVWSKYLGYQFSPFGTKLQATRNQTSPSPDV